MPPFNLSAWALRNQALVLYALILLGVIGAWSYSQLGQAEDPPFTFKVMVVQTQWPGATALEVAEQVTETIEKKLQEIAEVDYLRSYSRPGESQVFFVVNDAIPAREVAGIWYQVRKKVGDIRHSLPAEVQGPFFNDEFGDTFGNIYALGGDGFDYDELRDYAERIKRELLRVPDVAKVELLGRQEPRIEIEIANAKLATLGISLNEVAQTLQDQNAMVAAGSFETPTDRVYVRPSGAFDSVESIREVSLRGSNGRLFRLGDIAEVVRGFVDPPQPQMRFRGEPVLGLAVSMRAGGDIIALGHDLDALTHRISSELPVGLQLHKVSDQPAAVRESVNEFLRTLAEAVLIVLLVSFFSLGLRSGLVVAISIPLVLAMTFAGMFYFGIDLHKTSLGALVLGLGLLVDDAIIAIEMMAIKMEQGVDRLNAAAFAYTSTAFPMLTGTLVTVAGFLPIATARSGTGEYTRAIFEVVTLALLLSWIAAVVFIPYLGYHLLADPHAPARPRNALVQRWSAMRESLPGWLGGGHATAAGKDPYATPFYVRLRRLINFCVGHRKMVIVITVAVFALSLFGFRFVQQQFFPDSTRLELLVDLKLAEGSSLDATAAQVKKLEAWLAQRPELDNYVSYVGSGTPRFYLPLDQQLPQASFAELVLLAHSVPERDRLHSDLLALFEEDFSEVRARVLRLENGPPVGYPLQFRVSGEDIASVREHAREVAALLRSNAHTRNVNLDWEEPSKRVGLLIDQERARALGVNSADLAHFLQSSLSGTPVATYRERDQLIKVMLRGDAAERAELGELPNLSVPTAAGQSLPLAQIASLEYGFEEGIIWRRNRLPTVTVRADVDGRLLPASVAAQLMPGLAELRAALPVGYLLENGGAIEESAKGQGSVNAGIPLFLLVVFSVLMLQLRSFQRVLLVVLTAPLGLIGVVALLLLLQVPFGFVAMLGTIALFGMIMRNSVILVDQIEQDIRAGHARWDAVVDATVRRFRPIVLTATAAILAMIPLSRSAFFGPMAIAIMGGLSVATVLTILFLPALYAAWFRVRRDEPPAAVGPTLAKQ